jgi:membrane associated rhomboid family serine protease
MSQPYRRAGGGFSLGNSLSTMVRLLIAWNVIFFFVQLLAGRFIRGLDVAILLNLGLVPQAVWDGHLWQLVTYMFLHGGLFHLAFNMLALWMFGSELEYLWGSRRFLIYYFFTGVGAGITSAVFDPNSTVPIVGASGAIFGLLLAFGMYFPNRPILIWFLFPVPAKYFVIIFGAFEFFASLPRRGGLMSDGVAHLAHLGGLVFGFLYLKDIPMRWFRRSRRRRRSGRDSRVFDIRDYVDPEDRDSRWH